MSNFEFGADQMVDELVQFNQNLSKGVKNLLDADEISSGVTPREEVGAVLDILDRRKILGMVLNGADINRESYGYY